MSTRCLIGFLKNNRVIYSYCHFDGYPSGVGKMLCENYNTPNLAEAIASAGMMESLEPHIDQIDFIKAWPFHKEVDYDEYKTTRDYGVDYVYLYEGDRWFVRPTFFYDIDTLIEEDGLTYI